MKRTLLATSALTMLLMATPAFALSSTCKTVLSLPPVSPYVRAVLDRADAGINFANASADTQVFGGGPGDWMDRVAADFAALINANVDVNTQQDDLTQASACLNFDKVEIECEIDKVRDTFTQQMQKRPFVALLQLEPLLTFLNNRLIQLRQGALNPAYQDNDWNNVFLFDPPATVYCVDGIGSVCTQRTQADCAARQGSAFRTQAECVAWGGLQGSVQTGTTTDDVMCPYDSDYGPPIENGFGCDTDVLSKRTDYAPIKTEYDTLVTIKQQIAQFRQSEQKLLGVEQDIDAFYGIPAQSSQQQQQPPKHLVAVGCKWTGGLCQNDPKTRCLTNDDCQNGGTCAFTTGVCTQNRNIQCINDSQCQAGTNNVGPCIANDGKQPSNIELRGPFSIPKNEIELTSAFLAKRLQDAASRTFSTDLTFANEVSPLAKTGGTIPDTNVFVRMVGATDRLLNVAWSLMQGRDEASVFPAVTDPQLEIANALAPLRQAVGDLARLVTVRKKGIRSFVINYAYFLRRSCTYRPCNASLQEVIRIAFSDKCFPYTNGDFLSDTPSQPRWQQCADDAGISLP